MRNWTRFIHLRHLVSLGIAFIAALPAAAIAVDGNRPVARLTEIVETTSNGHPAVSVSADRPLVYSYYKIQNPPRAVIDLAYTDPGDASSPSAGGFVRKIQVEKQALGENPSTRLELELSRDVDFSVRPDPQIRGKILITFDAPAESSDQMRQARTSGEESSYFRPERRTAFQPAEPEARPRPAETAEQPETPASASATTEERAGKAGVSDQAVITGVIAIPDALLIQASGSLKGYKVLKLSGPERLMFDFPGARTTISASRIDLVRGGVNSARIGADPDKVRVVFDASPGTFASYNIVESDTGLRVELAAQQATPVPAPAPRRKPAAAAADPASGTGSVEAINFAVEGGVSRITIRTTSGCTPEEPSVTPAGTVFTLRDCLLPKKLQRGINTSRFPSSIVDITPYQVRESGRSDTRIVLKLRSSVDVKLRRDQGDYILEAENPPEVAAMVPPAPPAMQGSANGAPAAAESADVSKKPGEVTKKEYTGRRVTLEFSDADIRKIFQLIAEVSNLNFLIGDDVAGTISIKLVNVPWDQALDVILESKGLAKKQEGNILYIRPKNKIMTLEEEEVAARKASEKAMEVQLHIFDVNYAAVGEIEGQFRKLMRHPTASVNADTRTNKIFVKDIPPAIEDMKFMLKNLDLPEKQVMIEARIVEASNDFTQNLGVQWGLHYKDGSASIAGINKMDTGFGGIVAANAPSTGTSGGGINSGISFGTLTSNVQLDLKLAAAASKGQVKIISTPKIATLNNKQAQITQGQSIPYATTSAEGTKTEFVQAALTLQVTPRVNPDGSVLLKVQASNNAPGSGDPPQINTKQATTELLVKNGETTVIGGIYVDSDSESEEGVPLLKDIPFLGNLFKSKRKSKIKSEMLIFITPRIIG